jgi:hypothetical protein
MIDAEIVPVAALLATIRIALEDSLAKSATD